MFRGTTLIRAPVDSPLSFRLTRGSRRRLLFFHPQCHKATSDTPSAGPFQPV